MDEGNTINPTGDRSQKSGFAYRGGNWNNGANAGVFSANGNYPRSNVNTNIGFRSALPPNVRSLVLMWHQDGTGGQRDLSPFLWDNKGKRL